MAQCVCEAKVSGYDHNTKVYSILGEECDLPECWHPLSWIWGSELHLGPRWRWLLTETAAETKKRKIDEETLMCTITYSICKAVIFYADNCVITESYESYRRESLTHGHYNPELGESHACISPICLQQKQLHQTSHKHRHECTHHSINVWLGEGLKLCCHATWCRASW